jgi:putative ABC transport system permease protein
MAQANVANLLVVGRLKPGISIRQAQAELSGLSAQLAASDPERNKGKGALLQSLQEAAYGGLRQPLLLLQGAVAFVLLIGCANVAGLLLARAASRRTEVAVRAAIGAGRWRIVRQLLTESLLLSLLGGVAGVGLAWAGLRLFVASAPPGFPRLNELSLDASVLGFTVLVSLGTGLLFGIVPALQTSKADLTGALKESGRSGTDGVVRQRLRSGMVTVQIALALVLLIGAGLMINSFVRVQHNDTGAEPKGVLTFYFGYSFNEGMKTFGRYRGVALMEVNPKMSLTFDRILERMQGLPGVVSAAAISRPPLSAPGTQMGFLIDGRPAPPPGNAPGSAQAASYFSTTPNFFATMKIPVLRGRDFTPQDTAAGTRVIIINQAMARRYWPGEDPVGKRITLDLVPDEPVRQIIGVVGDTRASRFQKDPQPSMYVPQIQQTANWPAPNSPDRLGMVFVMRASGDPLSLVPAVRRAVADVESSKPVTNVRTVEDYLALQVQYVRLYVVLLSVFGAIAAVLAGVGIYGVMSYAVIQRTHEIGIRMAIGASSRDVLVLVIRQALVLIAIGLVLGLAGSFALTRLIKSALFGITATDPATFVAVSLLLMLIALAASFIPTRREVDVYPTVSLRYE